MVDDWVKKLGSRFRILLWDIETLPLQALTFGMWKQNINPKWITEDTSICMVAYRWLGSDSTEIIHVGQNPERYADNPYDDQGVVMEFAEQLEKADFAIAHNGDKFDYPILRGRMWTHGLPQIRVKTIDTLKVVKRIGRMSRGNGLSAVAGQIGVARKILSSAEWWRSIAMESNVENLLEMATYCKRDVDVLHDVFINAWPYAEGNFPHMGRLFGYDETSCDRCGSPDTSTVGVSYKIKRAYDRHECNECGRLFEGGVVK